MFDRIFDLARRPFAATPDPACFFAGEAVYAALDELVMCVERGQGIGILTADPGLGKTLLCQCLVQKLADRFLPVFLSNSNIADCRSLLQTILCELGEDYSGKNEHELRLSLRQRIQRLPPSQQALVLIVDEAHHFPTEVLEEVRLLADISNAGQSLVRVILSGQMSLEERLTDRAFDALNQRVCAHVTLLPMTLSESRDYLEFRLEWAGGKPESLINYLAIQLIARASAGVPRCLNQLADHCLILAVANDKRPVDPEAVRVALGELKQLPLQWNDLHELSSFATVGNDEHTADVESDFDHDAADATAAESSVTVAHEEFDEPQQSMPAADSVGAAATSITFAETSAFEFGGNEQVSESIPLEPLVATAVSPSVADSAASNVVAAEPVSGNIDAGFDPLSTDGVCITISSPRRSRVRVAESAVEPVAPMSEGLAVASKTGAAGSSLSVSQPLTTASPSTTTSRAAAILRPRVTESLKDVSAKIHSATSHEDFPVPKFVEEIVVDHYAALQEPEFSGIIWNLARQSDSTDSVADAAAAPEADVSREQAALGGAVNLPCVTIEFGPGSSLDLEPVRVQPVDAIAAKVSKQRDDDQDEAPLTDGFVSDIRPLQPTRFLDAIMPLISEALGQDEDNDYESNAQRISRAEGEVEADLIDELATGELDIEDQIAAEVLELRLDTQAAIRQSRLADFRSLERDLDTVQSQDDDEFEAELRAYDVVQPPHVPTSKHPAKVEPPASGGRESTDSRTSEKPPTEPTRRPFGRLFSELRRRQE